MPKNGKQKRILQGLRVAQAAVTKRGRKKKKKRLTISFIYIFFFILHISFSYTKILRETNFQPWEFPQSGSKAEDIKEEERELERISLKKLGNFYFFYEKKLIFALLLIK